MWEPLTDPDTGLVVAPLDKGRALDLVDHLPCVVHLLKEFRMKRIQELPQLNLHLSGSTDASGNVVGMLLIKIEHGRRGVITLDCRLLCVAAVQAGCQLTTASLHHFPAGRRQGGTTEAHWIAGLPTQEAPYTQSTIPAQCLKPPRPIRRSD